MGLFPAVDSDPGDAPEKSEAAPGAWEPADKEFSPARCVRALPLFSDSIFYF